jgi:hypothetical protein
VAGLDLPVKLRRGLGKGQVVPAQELAERLKPYDANQDGLLVRAELARFLAESRVGGPWFCELLTKVLWKAAQERAGREVEAIGADALGRVIHYSMSRGPRPERRYVLSPAAVNGLEPRRTLDGSTDLSRPPDPRTSAAPTGAAAAAPRPAAPGPRPGPLPSPRPGPMSGAARPQPSVPGTAGPPRSTAAPAPRRPGPSPKPRG